VKRNNALESPSTKTIEFTNIDRTRRRFFVSLVTFITDHNAYAANSVNKHPSPIQCTSQNHFQVTVAVAQSGIGSAAELDSVLSGSEVGERSGSGDEKGVFSGDEGCGSLI
jgi:hypothetical protein